MDKRTFIELPGDEYGNRGYTALQPVVILVDYEPGAQEGAGRLHILEPKSFRDNWPTVSEWRAWIEVTYRHGPISEKEYVYLLMTQGVDIPPWMIEAAEKRAGLDHGISEE